MNAPLSQLKKLLPIWLLAALATPMVLAQDSPSADAPQAAVAVEPDTVSVRDVVSNEQIQSRLQSILSATKWYQQINVESLDGVVVLSGSTDSEEHRQWADRLASRTEGVVIVRNEIEVSSSIDFSSSWQVILSSLYGLWKDFLRRLPLLLAAVLVIAATWAIANLAASMMRRFFAKTNRFRPSLRDLLALLVTIAIWVAGLLVAAVVAFPGMTPAKALAVLGLGSVAIGFAFKDIFENFFAGVLILWRYPLDPGDIVQIGSVIGRVEEITVRNTLIRRLDGELTVVPNANIFKQDVDVLTNRKVRRVQLTCGVAYDEDVDTARDVIRKAVTGCDSVNSSQDIHVLADCFADSSINFEIFWWTKASPMDIRQSRDQVVTAIKRGLDDAGIEIPFPYRTLTFKEPLNIHSAQHSASPDSA